MPSKPPCSRGSGFTRCINGVVFRAWGAWSCRNRRLFVLTTEFWYCLPLGMSAGPIWGRTLLASRFIIPPMTHSSMPGLASNVGIGRAAPWRRGRQVGRSSGGLGGRLARAKMEYVDFSGSLDMHEVLFSGLPTNQPPPLLIPERSGMSSLAIDYLGTPPANSPAVPVHDVRQPGTNA